MKKNCCFSDLAIAAFIHVITSSVCFVVLFKIQKWVIIPHAARLFRNGG